MPEPNEDVLAVWRAAAADYPTERTRAQKAGLSLSWAARKNPLPLTDPQNAAMLYSEMRKVGGDAGSPAAHTLFGFASLPAPTPVKIAQAQQARDSCAELRLVHQAAARRECDFNYRSPDSPRPELSELRNAARLLRAESLLLACQREGMQAVSNQTLGFRITGHAAADNVLIGWLVAIAVDAIALAGMAQILTTRKGDSVTATAIADVLDKDWKPIPLAPVMAGETGGMLSEIDKARRTGFRAYLQRNIDDMLTGFPGDSKAETETAKREAQAELERSLHPITWAAIRASKANEKLLLDASAAFILRNMRRLKTAADLSYPQAKPVFEAVRHDLATRPVLSDGQKAIRLIPEYLMGTMTFPLESKTYGIAWARTTLAAARLLVQAYAKTNAVFPETVMNLPLDPFTSQPLRYRREGKGFIVYSVGPDGTFNGGKPGVRLTGRENSLFFRYAPNRS